MNRMWVAAGLLAGLAGVAPAQPLTGTFEFQVSINQGQTWTNSAIVPSGGSYLVRALASWTDGTTPSVGFAGAAFEQIDIIGATTADTYMVSTMFKRQGVAESWSLQAGTGASAVGLKIDNIVPTGRTTFGQLSQILPGGAPNPNFDASNPIEVWRMESILGHLTCDVTFSATWTRLSAPPSNEFKIFTTPTGTNKKPAQEATLITAHVQNMSCPTPGPVSLLAMSGLMAVRRRGRV